MSGAVNIQEEFLKRLHRDGCTVKVITINGFQLVGRVVGWDQFTLLVEDRDGRENLVYKSAVSTIVQK